MTTLNAGLEKALNNQLNSELYSAHLYLSMGAYFESANLKGFAHWMRVQSQEEVSHAMRVFDHINDRNGRVVVQAVDQPPAEFESVQAVMELTLEHERKITAMIEDLYREAEAQGDYATKVMLDWFIQEQVEEEKSALEIVEQLKRIGDTGTGLLFLDSQLADRSAE